jgi:membrane fusion protein
MPGMPVALCRSQARQAQQQSMPSPTLQRGSRWDASVAVACKGECTRQAHVTGYLAFYAAATSASASESMDTRWCGQGGAMRHALFRQEALDFHQAKLLGDVVLVRPLSVSLLTGVAVLIALTVVGFACWGEYTRKTHVTGYLEPNKGLIKVYAPQAGTLIEKHVTEGQAVKQGDILFVVSSERSSRETPEAQAAAMAQLRRRRASLQEEFAKQEYIDRIQFHAVQDRVRSMEAELVHLTVELELQEQRVASAADTAQRYRLLVAKSLAPEMQAQQKREELLDQQSKLHSLQRSRLTLEGEMHTLKRELASGDLKAKNQRAAIERQISALEQELTEYESRRQVVMRAPGDGVVTTILGVQGQNITTTTPLLSLVPAEAVLEAHLLVPSRAIGFIAPRQAVAVRYQAFPYQRFGSAKGHITAIAKTLITPNEVTFPVPLQEPVYRVTVALEAQTVTAYGVEMPLQAGMVLDADIWLEQRRIIAWVFDPLYSITGRL